MLVYKFTVAMSNSALTVEATIAIDIFFILLKLILFKFYTF